MKTLMSTNSRELIDFHDEEENTAYGSLSINTSKEHKHILIKAATIGKLIQKITPANGNVNEELSNLILYTHTMFIKNENFLFALISRFHGPEKSKFKDESEYHKSIKNISDAVSSFLYNWYEKTSVFEKDESLKEKLFNFINNMQNPPDKLWKIKEIKKEKKVYFFFFKFKIFFSNFF